MLATRADELLGRLPLGPRELVEARLNALVQILDALFEQAAFVPTKRLDYSSTNRNKMNKYFEIRSYCAK